MNSSEISICVTTPEKDFEEEKQDDIQSMNTEFKFHEFEIGNNTKPGTIIEENTADADASIVKQEGCKGLRKYFLVSKSERIYSRVRQAHCGVEEERARHLNSFPSTIHPYSDFRWVWDIFMTIVLVLTLVGQPLQIAFYPQSMAHLNSAILGCIISFIFSFDMFLNFRTGFVAFETDVIILEPRTVALKYFKTWFLVDLISTIPFDTIYVALNDFEGDGQLYFRYFRLLELLKILRLARVVRYLGRIERAYEVKSVYSRGINLLIMMFFLIHWLGCMHYLVADMVNSFPYPRKEFSWLSQMDLWDKPVWEKYAHCVLRALSNMACLGYGFVTPRAPEDVICTLVSIMIGATCFALFIANVSSIVLNLDSSHKKYLESLNQTIDYMNFKHVPKPLQNKVVSYFEQRYRRNLFNEEEIMSNVSDVLRQKLQMFNCQRLVQEVPLFHGIANEILQEIVAQLKFELYLPNDVIIAENTIGSCMYFIENGTVQVVGKNGKVFNQLHQGNFFGEMALITNHRRAATVIAKTPCYVYRLEKTDFEKVIHQYPEIYENIVKVAKERQRQKKYVERNGTSTNADETVKTSNDHPHRTSIQELDFSLKKL